MDPVSSGQGASSVASPPSTGSGGSSGSCQCGKKKGSRIVGGQETEVNEYPWMGALMAMNGGFLSQICGGSLIAANWVVTAAHCFFNTQGVRVLYEAESRIRLGEHDLNSVTESKIEKTVGVQEILLHEKYHHQTSDNDIALLKLSESVDLNVYTPVCLP